MCKQCPSSTIDQMLGALSILVGAAVLGYVVLHLLWWIFLVVVGLVFIGYGLRMRRRAHFIPWSWRWHND